MISKRQKKAIINVLGHRYCLPISEALSKQGVINRNNLPHSNSKITNVMNGVGHKEIEAVIFELVEEKKQSLLNEEEYRKRILSKK